MPEFEFANARSGERDRAVSHGSGARERDHVAQTPEQVAAKRVELLWHDAVSAKDRAAKLSGIVVRQEWREERVALQVKHQGLQRELAARAVDAEHARERYKDAAGKIKALGEELEHAKEPRAKPPVRDEVEVETSILSRTMPPEQLLAWVASLSGRERKAVEDRVVSMGSADREDGFAVALSNYFGNAGVRKAWEAWAKAAGVKAGPGQPGLRDRFLEVARDPRHWVTLGPAAGAKTAGRPDGKVAPAAASSPAAVSSSPDVSRSANVAPVQLAPASGTTKARSGDLAPAVVPPEAGIEKPGFIDNSKGAPIYTAPTEAGGVLVRDEPLPPAARVFASGTHPRLKRWWYVTAYLDGTMLRGYIEDFRVNIDLPEPLAELRQLHGGETPEGLAKEKFGGAVRDGHDLRYYENVLLHVNQGRAGIGGTYQDPNVLGGGSNNIKLYKNHRIWLVSPEYAKAVEGVVPSGSLTGGAVAKVKRFAGHLQDIVQSVTESRHHFGEVAGEFAQAIRDHLPAIVGITAGFLILEAGSMFLATTPTGVGQAAAAVIQLALTSFGAAGMVEGGMTALKHGGSWLKIAWTANGKPEVIAEASKEFLRMLVAVAIAALSFLGAKANYGNALKIANNMPTGGLPSLATAGARTTAGAGPVTGVSLGPGVGGIGAVGSSAARLGDKDEPGNLFDSYGEDGEACYKDDPPGTAHEDAPRSEFSDGYGLKTEEQLARERKDPNRPEWQDSEWQTNKDLDWADFSSQRTFGRGKDVRRGMAGAKRPDGYSEQFKLSVEVKNYGVRTHMERLKLVKRIVQQVLERAPHHPKGSRQGVVIDVRGQMVPSSTLTELRARIVHDARGLVAPDDVVFLTE
jgi:hypothetical protein